jgi:hypothetical protein
VNQIEPSDFTTTSFGRVQPLAVEGVHQHRDRSVIFGAGDAAAAMLAGDEPSLRSRVLPLAKFDGLRKMLTAPVSSSHLRMRWFGMSLHSR